MSENPYAVPPTPVEEVVPDAVLLAKIEAVIKDADQYILAIFLCIVCVTIGPIVIGPWYYFRWRQWRALAKSQPQLLEPGVPPGCVAHRFQQAKGKLVIGAVFGALCVLSAFAFATFVLLSES